jgi:SulP family sulfate permease
MIFPITIVVSFIVSTISYNSLTKFSRTNVLLKCNQQNNQSISNTLSSVKSASSSIFRESLSGFVVSLSTLPPSAAYASLIGLNPLIGIWSSFIVGSIVALLAGGPGVIAGAAGVIAIPIAKLVHEHGLAYMGAAIMLAGLIESLFGLLKLGKLSKYVTEPVIAGFLNSFSLFLIKAQVCCCVS